MVLEILTPEKKLFGGSWSTVRGLLWRTLKRYGGWMAAAGVIYDIATECF